MATLILKKIKNKKQLTANEAELLFNYEKADRHAKSYAKLKADLKDSGVAIVDENGGQVFASFKGHNIHAQTKHKEYFVLDTKKLLEELPEVYEKYKVKAVHSVTLEVNANKK